MKNPIKERAEHIALYIDLENFVGYCLGLGLPIDLGPELTRLTELGKITVRRSFGDIYRLPLSSDKKLELRRMLQHNLIQHEDIPHFNSYKNTSDIRLVIDALSTAFTNEDIDMVAVVASDRDYLPLFAKLREIGKEIIGIGGNRDNTPELYVKACDYFFYHEVLTGCAPQPQLAVSDVGVDLPATGKMPELSSIGVSEAATETGGSTFAHSPEQSEAVQLLVDALQALEAKGSSVHSGASVIQMMRRLKADFDLSGYGYASLKQLCEQAETSGRIEIEHNGVIFNLRLAPPVPVESETAPTQAAEPIQGTNCSQLRGWLEQKLRISLPGDEERKKIFQKLLAILQGIDDEGGGVKLTSLADEICAGISRGKEFQPACYKLLYSLYRANCFTCSPGETPYNPIIQGLRDHEVPAPETLDARFIENTLRVYVRECRTPVDEEGWSEVFFGSKGRSDLIRDIVRTL